MEHYNYMANAMHQQFVEYLSATQKKSHYVCVTNYTRCNENITVQCTKHNNMITTTPVCIKRSDIGPCYECISEHLSLLRYS